MGFDREKTVITVWGNQAVSCRRKNSRIDLHERDCDFNEFTFVRVLKEDEDSETIGSVSEVYRDKLLVTKIGFSDDSLESLYVLLGKYLEKKQNSKL